MISEGSAHRLLFKAEGIGTLGNVAISRAYVEFAVQGDPADRALHLSLCPVTRAWSPGAVTWRKGSARRIWRGSAPSREHR
jgi:hypothetical protein